MSILEIAQMQFFAGKAAVFPWTEVNVPTQEEVDEGARVLEKYSAFKEG